MVECGITPLRPWLSGAPPGKTRATVSKKHQITRHPWRTSPPLRPSLSFRYTHLLDKSRDGREHRRCGRKVSCSGQGCDRELSLWWKCLQAEPCQTHPRRSFTETVIPVLPPQVRYEEVNGRSSLAIRGQSLTQLGHWLVPLPRACWRATGSR